MKITISTSQQGQQPLTDRIVVVFQNSGAQLGVRKIDRKLDLLAPIDWVGVTDEAGWDYSSLVDSDKQTVLLIAETTEPIPTDAIRDVGLMLNHMNSRSDYGHFAFNDREGTVLYLAGPFIYDRAGFVLRHAIDAMHTAIGEISSGLERAATSVSVGRARHILRRETYRQTARPVLTS